MGDTMNSKFVIAVGAIAAAFAVKAEIKLAAPFADGMVLQRGREVPVWGKAEPGRKVTVAFGDAEVATIACAKGCWKVALPAMEASKESRTLTVTESEIGWLWDSELSSVEVKDVLVGEVWMCSGQSNTDCPIWSPGGVRYRDGQGALALQMTMKPFVRYVKTPRAWDAEPKKDVEVKWMKATPEMFELCRKGARMPSAMGYYFALELANSLDIPVGLVDSSVGGTNIDSWTPKSGYAGISGLDGERDWKTVGAKEWKDSMRKGPVSGGIQQPRALWNGMVAAYVPMACRGFIWYQGCHNNAEADRYCAKMHALYKGWKTEFKNPDLKLYFVELAPYKCSWFNIHKSQAKFAAEEPNAGMVSICDVGNISDIHPNDKRTVGKRLAALALKRDYGFTALRADCPTFKSAKAEGAKMILSFNDVESWYVYNTTIGDPAVGFELAGADGAFKPAKLDNIAMAKGRDGKPTFRGVVNGKDLVLVADGVAAPKKVRYLYQAPYCGSLFNESSLPLGSFEAEVK